VPNPKDYLSMKKSLILPILAAISLSGCLHPDPYVRRGRAGGAVGGAVLGGVIGHNVKGVSKWEGAAVGGLVGGLMGDARGKANSSYYRRPYGGYYY
jgi:hypothetical protein